MQKMEKMEAAERDGRGRGTLEFSEPCLYMRGSRATPRSQLEGQLNVSCII